MLTRDKVSSWVVLVVDDEPDSLEVATRVLKYHGAQVLVALNGRDAVEVLKLETPTFILSDLSMPGMDGWTLIEYIQGNARTKSIPVIALTAHAMSGDREKALAAGFHYYLTKPLSPLTFLEDLLRLFSEATAPIPAGNGAHAPEAAAAPAEPAQGTPTSEAAPAADVSQKSKPA